MTTAVQERASLAAPKLAQARPAIRREIGDDGICVLTFDRPNSSANVFDRATLQELDAHLDFIAGSTELRGVVLASAKNSIFIAGADLHAVAGDLVLGATVGLKHEAVGRVRMRLDEGLTGLVGEELRPVMVAEAFHHPRFKYFPEAGEDPYHSFLGVPLIEGGTLQGVLVVQTREERTFLPGEVRLLVTVAAQLAPSNGPGWTAHERSELAGRAERHRRAAGMEQGVR